MKKSFMSLMLATSMITTMAYAREQAVVVPGFFVKVVEPSTLNGAAGNVIPGIIIERKIIAIREHKGLKENTFTNEVVKDVSIISRSWGKKRGMVSFWSKNITSLPYPFIELSASVEYKCNEGGETKAYPLAIQADYGFSKYVKNKDDGIFQGDLLSRGLVARAELDNRGMKFNISGEVVLTLTESYSKEAVCARAEKAEKAKQAALEAQTHNENETSQNSQR